MAFWDPNNHYGTTASRLLSQTAILNLESLEMFETSLEMEKQQKPSKSHKHGKPSKKDQVWKLAAGRHWQRKGEKYVHGSDGKGCLEWAASRWEEHNAYYEGESTEPALSSPSASSSSNSKATSSLFINSPALHGTQGFQMSLAKIGHRHRPRNDECQSVPNTGNEDSNSQDSYC